MPFDFCDVTWQGCSLCCSPHAGCAGLWHASTFQETTQSQSGKGFFSWSILQPCHILPCFLAFSPGDPVEVADAPALSPKSARVSTIHSGDPTNCLGQVLLNLTFIFHPDLVWSNLDPPTKTPPKKELEYFACVLTNSSLVTNLGVPHLCDQPTFSVSKWLIPGMLWSSSTASMWACLRPKSQHTASTHPFPKRVIPVIPSRWCHAALRRSAHTLHLIDGQTGQRSDSLGGQLARKSLTKRHSQNKGQWKAACFWR